LLKLVAFVLRRKRRISRSRRRIRTDDQATGLWSVFVRRFSVARRNPQGGKATGEYGAGGARYAIVFPAVNISNAAGVKSQ
jgi:hypothetical protein